MLLRFRCMLHFFASHMSVLLIVSNASQPFGSDCQAHGHTVISAFVSPN
jgi:hypothetical protein